MLKRCRRLLAVPVLLVSACSGNSASGASESNEVAFKSADIDGIVAGAGVTTVVALPFDAPADGFVSVSATGTCAVVEALPVRSVLVAHIETDPTDRAPHSGDASFELGDEATGPLQGSFSSLRAWRVMRGHNTASLTIDNPSSGGKLYCSASMSILFASQQLL